jgi:flavodoxin
MGKILVVYYSFEGNTKHIAEVLAEYLKADIQEVKPKKELQTKGFYKFIWGGRQAIMKVKPELMPMDVNFEDYDVILVGSPIWAGTYAPPIRTLLEDSYIKGKKIAYFYTHQGGDAKALVRTKELIEKHNIYLSSKDFLNPLKREGRVEEEAINWAKSLFE